MIQPNFSRMIKIVIAFLALTLLATYIWLLVMRGPASSAQAPVDSNTISIPSDLKSRFDSGYDELLRAQTTIEKRKPELEQIMRIALDRAGVTPAEFQNWEFDKDSRSMKKKK